MHEIVRDILAIEGVNGVIALSQTGEILFEHSRAVRGKRVPPRDWRSAVEALTGLREADLVYDRGRLYLRRTVFGFLLVVADLFAQGALIRLNCDIVLAALAGMKPGKRRRLFKR